MAKICLSSTRIYDHEIGDISKVLISDMELYNRMLHYSYKLLLDDYRYNNHNSVNLVKHLKDKFGTNDYFPLNTVLKSRAILNAQLAADRNYHKLAAKKMKLIRDKIRKETKDLNRDIKILEKIISYSKGKSRTIKCSDFVFNNTDDTCIYNGKEMSLYLYEVTVLKPRIKSVKNRLSKLHFAYNRWNYRYNSNKLKGICFGGKKLMKSRNTVYHNNHDQWLDEYRKARNSSMMITGRAQGRYCNNLFKYDGADTMTYISVSKKKYHLKVDFPYKKEELLRVLKMKHATPGKAVCYTLCRKNNYFILKAAVELQPKSLMYDAANGTVGVDINADHIAAVETDRYGNIININTIRYNLADKTANQRKHILLEAAKQVIEMCEQNYKPLTVEQLNFDFTYNKYDKTKRRTNRKLSEYAYRKILEYLNSRAYKQAIGIIEVNPAYTSIIGKYKYSKPLGISVHLAAAYCIARKGQGYKEKVPERYKGLVNPKMPLIKQWQAVNKALS